VVNVREREARFLKAIANGRSRKASGVLNAIEAFLFDGGDQPAAAHNGGGSVAVIRVDSENVHGRLVGYPKEKQRTRGSRRESNIYDRCCLHHSFST